MVDEKESKSDSGYCIKIEDGGEIRIKSRTYNILHILSNNGWEWLKYESDLLSSTTEYTQYAMRILGLWYTSTVVLIISNLPKHLECNGHYGILWLEAIYEYENVRNGCLSYDDMKDMQQAIINAEENLLKICMPFSPNYEFHGRNKANMKRRNDKLRRIYDLDSIEERDFKKIEW